MGAVSWTFTSSGIFDGKVQRTPTIFLSKSTSVPSGKKLKATRTNFLSVLTSTNGEKLLFSKVSVSLGAGSGTPSSAATTSESILSSSQEARERVRVQRAIKVRRTEDIGLSIDDIPLEEANSMPRRGIAYNY